jgi:hypothetical protein
MKSKEEIEKLAFREAEKLHDKNKHDDWDIYNQLVKEDAELIALGYIKCQEDMKIVISEWQLCPMCIGEGIVQNVGTSSSMYRTCPVCNGNKTLIKPITT